VLAELAGDVDAHAVVVRNGVVLVIELGPNRELALRLPDGTVHNTGPPGRRTAA
jgi:hypothetical protein